MNRLRYFIDERAPRLALTLRLAKHWLAGSVELAAMREHVRPGATVVDIGARRGLFTAYLARRVGREGYVHAFEPFPPNFATLERLFGGCGNVVLHELALSSAPGEATLTVPIRGGRPADALGSLSAPPSASRNALMRPVPMPAVAMATAASTSA